MNVMSVELYNTLRNKQPTPTTTQFSTFDNQPTPCLGTVITTLHFGEKSKEIKFYLVADKEQKSTLILGRTWLHSHQCNINWNDMHIQVTFNGVRIQTSMIKPTPARTKSRPVTPPSRPNLKHSVNNGKQAIKRNGYQKPFLPHKDSTKDNVKFGYQRQQR